MTSSVRMWAAIAQPTIRRENTSSTTARYSHPSPVGTYVMSAVQVRFGADAVKSRLTRSCGGTTAGSRRVRPRLRRRCTPSIRAARISRATRLRPTRTPNSSRSSAWIRGAP